MKATTEVAQQGRVPTFDAMFANSALCVCAVVDIVCWRPFARYRVTCVVHLTAVVPVEDRSRLRNQWTRTLSGKCSSTQTCF